MSTTRNAVLELDLERFRYSGAEHDTLAGICLSLVPGSLTAIVGDSVGYNLSPTDVVFDTTIQCVNC